MLHPNKKNFKLMDKFTKFQKVPFKTEEQPTEQYKGKYLSIIKHKEWEFVKESDCVIILPYFKYEGVILLRSEYVPTYQFRYLSDDRMNKYTNFLTVVSGTIENDETPEQTIRRELYEECGIALSSLYKIDIDKHLFISKGNSSQYHTCLMELNYNDFKQAQIIGDGSEAENKSSTIKVDIGDLDQIQTYDLITDYMLMKLKLEYSLK